MSLTRSIKDFSEESVPRASGDEPLYTQLDALRTTCSPRERG